MNISRLGVCERTTGAFIVHINSGLAQTICHALPLWQWNVSSASIRFEFLPMSGWIPGQQTVDISFPRSCNLRSARSERVEIIQKYLKLWNIDWSHQISDELFCSSSSLTCARLRRDRSTAGLRRKQSGRLAGFFPILLDTRRRDCHYGAAGDHRQRAPPLAGTLGVA